jgi:hypothetical protein
MKNEAMMSVLRGHMVTKLLSMGDPRCPVLSQENDTPAAHTTQGEGTSQGVCTLTDEERDSLKFAINQMKYIRANSAAATLRALLERTK